MKKRFSPQELFELRNAIPVTQLIRYDLSIPSKVSEGIFRFLCPVCNEFQTATQSTTNLARCFRCERNFNTIDLVMAVKGWGFVDSALFLQRLLPKMGQNNDSAESTFQSLAAGIGFAMPGTR
jgi:hypothetical protein